MNLRNGDTVGRSVPISRQDVAVEALLVDRPVTARVVFTTIGLNIAQFRHGILNVSRKIFSSFALSIGSITGQGARDIQFYASLFSVLLDSS